MNFIVFAAIMVAHNSRFSSSLQMQEGFRRSRSYRLFYFRLPWLLYSDGMIRSKGWLCQGRACYKASEVAQLKKLKTVNVHTGVTQGCACIWGRLENQAVSWHGSLLFLWINSAGIVWTLKWSSDKAGIKCCIVTLLWTMNVLLFDVRIPMPVKQGYLRSKSITINQA